MRKIINTFKYGSPMTKGVLALTLVSGAATLGFAVSAIVFKQMLLFFCTLICVFITISLAQTFMIKGQESDDDASKTKTKSKGADTEDNQEEQTDEAEEHVADKHTDKVKKRKSGKRTGKSKKRKADKQTDKSKKRKSGRRTDKTDTDEYADSSNTETPVEEQTSDTHKTRKKKFNLSLKKIFGTKFHPSTEPEEQTETTESVEMSGNEAVSDTDTHEGGNQQEEHKGIHLGDEVENNLAELLEETETESEPAQKAFKLTEEEVKTYNRRKLKTALHKHKVKRDHRMVMVDHCDELGISHTPAYIWVQNKEFHMLLIEQEPRHITIPVFKLREVTYLKKQPGNEDVDYAAFKGGSMLAELFKPYLPDYTHSTVVDDLTAYKNLYGIGPGIYFTNRSAASLFDLLGAEFRVHDKVTMSPKANIYFKDTYKANILLRDNVIDANGYADRISHILDSMAKSTTSYNEFKDTLNLMVRNKLITQEFATYYMGVRDKISR